MRHCNRRVFKNYNCSVTVHLSYYATLYQIMNVNINKINTLYIEFKMARRV